MDNSILNPVVKAAEKANPRREGDYIGDDGLLYCGSCHTPKQTRLDKPVIMKGSVVNCLCRCATEAREAEREEIRKNERELMRREVFNSGNGMHHTFNTDDNNRSKLSMICRAYADKFSSQAKWLLLYGGCGVGKSFMAACIANRLIDRDFTVVFTSVSETERRLWNAENKSAVYDRLERCDLLVLDDLFSQRESSYMNEITFNIIDGRIRSGRPAVITTNISQNEFLKPPDLATGRIMSRLYENSIPILCEGEDRRLKNMRETAAEEIKKLLE